MVIFFIKTLEIPKKFQTLKLLRHHQAEVLADLKHQKANKS